MLDVLLGFLNSSTALIDNVIWLAEPKLSAASFSTMAAQTGTQAYDEYGRDDFSRTKNGNGADKGGPTLSKLGPTPRRSSTPRTMARGGRRRRCRRRA